MLPLVFSFEYPVTGLLQSISDVTSPFILNIQQWYNVKISFRQQTRQCVVRGSESWADKVKKATMILIEHLMGSTRVCLRCVALNILTEVVFMKLFTNRIIFRTLDFCASYTDNRDNASASSESKREL